MAAFVLRRLSSPEVLRKLEEERFLAFLREFRDYLKARGFSFPKPGQPPDYDQLVQVFMSPDGGSEELVDALWRIDELATDEGMDKLLTAAEQSDIDLQFQEDPCAADVAMAFWLNQRAVFDRAHAEQYIGRFRSSEFFQRKSSALPRFRGPSLKTLNKMTTAFDERFEARKRGRGCRIFAFDHVKSVWFLIRHGQGLRREESIKSDGSSTTTCYRPVKYDVVVYHRNTGELQIHAESPKDKEAYRKDFGKFLFKNENAFPGTDKYTLEPLRSGRGCLACGDVSSIESIKLKEVQILYPGSPWEIVIRKADDLYDLLNARKKEFPKAGRLIQAKFAVRFANARSARTVAIKPGNVVQARNEDDVERVDEWLRARGFVKEPKSEGEVQEAGEVLEHPRGPANIGGRSRGVAASARRRAPRR